MLRDDIQARLGIKSGTSKLITTRQTHWSNRLLNTFQYRIKIGIVEQKMIKSLLCGETLHNMHVTDMFSIWHRCSMPNRLLTIAGIVYSCTYSCPWDCHLWVYVSLFYFVHVRPLLSLHRYHFAVKVSTPYLLTIFIISAW